MSRIVECVPNFSEGRDLTIIDKITAEIQKINGVELLDVDPGEATNRTVVTIAGDPDAAVEAAFQAIKKASGLIDMTKQKGAHPRMEQRMFVPLFRFQEFRWTNVSNSQTGSVNELEMSLGFRFISMSMPPQNQNGQTLPTAALGNLKV